jgi:integral membrane sensor domain MASE1
MFIDWTVNDATAVNTAATLTMAFTFNLYSADISTGNTAFVASTYYTFAPYITILNADSSKIVANPFDAIVMPIEIFVDASTEVISALFNSGSYLYTTTDWTASDYNTLLVSDPISAPSA